MAKIHPIDTHIASASSEKDHKLHPICRDAQTTLSSTDLTTGATANTTPNDNTDGNENTNGNDDASNKKSQQSSSLPNRITCPVISPILTELETHVRTTDDILLVGPNFSHFRTYQYLLNSVQSCRQGHSVLIGEKGMVLVGCTKWEELLRIKKRRRQKIEENEMDFVLGDGVKIRGCLDGFWRKKADKKKMGTSNGSEYVQDVEAMMDEKTFLIRVECGRGWVMVFTIVAVWGWENEEGYFVEEDERGSYNGNGKFGVRYVVKDFSMVKKLNHGDGGRRTGSNGGSDGGEWCGGVKTPENVFLTEWTMNVIGSASHRGMEVVRYWPFEDNQIVRVAGEKAHAKEAKITLDVGMSPTIGGEIGASGNRTLQTNTGYQLFDTSAGRGGEKGSVQFYWNSSAWYRREARSGFNVDENIAKYLLGDEIPTAVGIPLRDGKEVGAFFRMPPKSFGIAQFEISVSGKFRKPTNIGRYKGAQSVRNITTSKFKLTLMGNSKEGSTSLKAQPLKASTTL